MSTQAEHRVGYVLPDRSRDTKQTGDLKQGDRTEGDAKTAQRDSETCAKTISSAKNAYQPRFGVPWAPNSSTIEYKAGGASLMAVTDSNIFGKDYELKVSSVEADTKPLFGVPWNPDTMRQPRSGPNATQRNIQRLHDQTAQKVFGQDYRLASSFSQGVYSTSWQEIDDGGRTQALRLPNTTSEGGNKPVSTNPGDSVNTNGLRWVAAPRKMTACFNRSDGAWIRPGKTLPWPRMDIKQDRRLANELKTSESSTDPSLLSLPPELRLIIWEKYLEPTAEGKVCCRRHHIYHNSHFELGVFTNFGPVLLQCRVSDYTRIGVSIKSPHSYLRSLYKRHHDWLNPTSQMVCCLKHLPETMPTYPLLFVCRQIFDELAPLLRKNGHTFSFSTAKTMMYYLGFAHDYMSLPRERLHLIRRIYVTFVVAGIVADSLTGLKEVLIPKSINRDMKPVVAFWEQRARVVKVDNVLRDL